MTESVTFDGWPRPLQVQEQVQKELDEHVGRERLVRLSDRAKLTYLDCVINEGMRIRPVSPVLIPHVAMTDSRYQRLMTPRPLPLGEPPPLKIKAKRKLTVRVLELRSLS